MTSTDEQLQNLGVCINFVNLSYLVVLAISLN